MPWDGIVNLFNRLRVFKRAKVAHLCSGGGPKRETRAVPSEQRAARWGSEYDEMRMITTSFARVLERCTGHLYMHFSRYFNRLDQFAKLATSYIIIPPAGVLSPRQGLFEALREGR